METVHYVSDTLPEEVRKLASSHIQKSARANLYWTRDEAKMCFGLFSVISVALLVNPYLSLGSKEVAAIALLFLGVGFFTARSKPDHLVGQIIRIEEQLRERGYVMVDDQLYAVDAG